MYFSKKIILTGCACLALSACMTATGPVEVTRFQKEGALLLNSSGAYQGSFIIDKEAQSLSLSPYSAAVTREMQRLGFDNADGNANYIVRVAIDRYESERPKNSNVSVGGGASTGTFGSGLGLGLGINLGGRKKRTHTELSVRISDRVSGTSVWEGRAVQSAKTGSPAAQEGIAASKLANALFQGFPGASGTTITVP